MRKQYQGIGIQEDFFGIFNNCSIQVVGEGDLEVLMEAKTMVEHEDYGLVSFISAQTGKIVEKITVAGIYYPIIVAVPMIYRFNLVTNAEVTIVAKDV